MTHQTNQSQLLSKQRRPLSQRVKAFRLPLILASAAVLVLGACGEEEKKTIVDNTPKGPPPPPPPPPLTPVSDLMMQYGIDNRIAMAENYAPNNDADRIAILKFFHTMVSGDTPTLSTMLTPRDRPELAALEADGSFQNAISEIGAVEVRSGITPGGDSAVVAVIQTYSDFHPQLWRFQADEFGGAEFSSGPMPLNVLEKLSGDDWVNRWYQLLDEEIAIAMQLDEEVELPQKDLSNDSNANINTGSGPTRPVAPPSRPEVEPPPSFAPDN